MRSYLTVLSALAILFTASSAAAVRSNRSGHNSINKGVFELGLENMLLFSQLSTDVSDEQTNTDTRLSYTGGLTGRYFIMPNLALGLGAGMFYANDEQEVAVTGQDALTTTTTDAGWQAYGMANYYLRLSNSFFFKPGVGAGWYGGTREVPGAQLGQKKETQLSGFLGKVDLGFVFWAGQQLNLKAGVDILFRAGTETDEAIKDDEGMSYTALEAGFNVGIGYSF